VKFLRLFLFLGYLILLAPSSRADVVDPRLMLQIRSAYSQVCAECRFEFTDLRVKPQVSFENQEPQVRTSSAAWSQGFLFPVEINGENKAWLTGQVKIFKKVWVAKVTLNRAQTVEADSLQQQWVQANQIKDADIKIEDLKNAQTKKVIGSGQPILKSDLMKLQVVQRGQSMQVSSGNEMFEVSTMMKADEAGALGDLLKFKSMDGSRSYMVKVLSENQGRLE
jgi:flagella basal body P-ring formation protein FlgA